MEQITKNVKEDLDKAAFSFLEEINKIRAGRPTPSLVEDINVSVYGSKMPIKQLASISVEGPRMIIVEPWDKNIVKEIEKALSGSDLNANVSASGANIRVALPELSEERRGELIKILHDKKEDARIFVRNTREKAVKETEEKEKNKEISEDDKFRFKKELQKIVDETNKKIEESTNKKEEELRTI